jgi:tRNA A37 threonylcarbamoyladenosine dehydratase
MGIGKMTLVDRDRFEESNINRQLCALTSTVGMYKVNVTAQRILDINPDITVIPIAQFHLPDSPVPIPDDVDMAVDAVDTISAKLHIIETCRNNTIPLISCMGMGNRLDPTQIKLGDIFQTRNCGLSRVIRKELRKRGVDQLRCVYSTEEAIRTEPEQPDAFGAKIPQGSVSYVPSVAGLLMAYDVVNTLLKQADSREHR